MTLKVWLKQRMVRFLRYVAAGNGLKTATIIDANPKI